MIDQGTPNDIQTAQLPSRTTATLYGPYPLDRNGCAQVDFSSKSHQDMITFIRACLPVPTRITTRWGTDVYVLPIRPDQPGDEDGILYTPHTATLEEVYWGFRDRYPLIHEPTPETTIATQAEDDEPTPSEIVDVPKTVGYLGIRLKDENHTAERAGKVVTFGGNVKYWCLLKALCARHGAYYQDEDLLHDVWDPKGSDGVAEMSTLYSTLSRFRKVIKPLGVKIRHTKGLGYRLEDKSE